MNSIELCFPVLGSQLSSDHGYALYSSLAKRIPNLHNKDCHVRIGPITGTYLGKGMIQLDHDKSRLRLRIKTEDIPQFLPLSGKSLQIADQKIRLGVPEVHALIPAFNLIARMVVIKASSPKSNPADNASRVSSLTKRYLEPAEFLIGARKQLEAIEIKSEPVFLLNTIGLHAGKERRHVIRIHDKQVVGFGLKVTGLTAAESIRLQEKGLGGRGKMGCGWFAEMKGANQ